MLSLADFFIGESSSPLRAPRGFSEWREHTAWAGALYEPVMLGGASPRVRMLIDGHEREAINLGSYNYLGLAQHPEVIAAARSALEKYGTGACGAPTLSGMTDLHRELEQRLSAFLGRESTLLFNSGFAGALGCMGGLLRRGDVAVLDAKAHFCLAEGAELAHARVETFAHNDLAALDAILSRHASRRRLVVVEGIYSMDGDCADLPAVCAIAEKHGAGVLIDEAHSVLTCGASGRGACEEFGVEDSVGLFYATFSKAFAGIGGFASGDAETIDYLRCYAHPYGYSCALPPATVAGLLAALDVATRDATLRTRLWENARYFRRALQGMGLNTGASVSHVVPIIIGADRRKLYTLGLELRRRGLFIGAIDFPAVPEDQVRFRAAITAAHSREDLDEALAIIRETIVPSLS